MDEINTIAIEHDLIVIEDAAHALEATYKGLPCISLLQLFDFKDYRLKQNFEEHFRKAGCNIQIPDSLEKFHLICKDNLNN